MTPLPLFSFLFLFLFVYVRAETNSSLHSSSPSANASVPLFSNTSSTSNLSFSYIIPYHQTQACDIYGSPCQTGSITVGVNLTTTTTTTTIPCSSYLSAQFTYLWNSSGEPVGGFWANGYYDHPNLGSWNMNFGQSPQCKSYAEAINQGQSTFSDCGSTNAPIQTDGGLSVNILQDVPGLQRYFDPMYWGTCCGNCSLDVPAVRLYYFPDKASIDCHINQTSNGTSTLSARGLEKRVHSLVATGSTAIVDGHTL